ncbi:MAG: hypothetical protein K6V36_15100, partial [Anaerolineae bacterium]|nr:hypothetical protein [Anaerolineae bacterium]
MHFCVSLLTRVIDAVALSVWATWVGALDRTLASTVVGIPAYQSSLVDLVAEFWPSVLVTILIVIAGFVGIQRLQTLEHEIRITREERDKLRQEVRDDVRETLKQQESRFTVLQETMDVRFSKLLERQQRSIGEQVAALRGDLEQVEQRAAGLVDEIE